MNDSLQRYSRQVVLPEVGVAGQRVLQQSRVAIVGMGGLGSPAALYLAAAGVGRFWLADFDRVDLTNLQRQVLYQEADVGRRKVDVARERLLALNSDAEVTVRSQRLDATELPSLLRDVDVLLDCSDNFRTRFALNRAAIAARCTLVVAAAIRTQGQAVVLQPGQGSSPCYACIFGEHEDAEERCEDAGVMAPLVGIIGSLAAQLTFNRLLGLRDGIGILHSFDALSARFSRLPLPRAADCPACAV